MVCIGDDIRKYRKEAKLTSSQLAELVGCTQGTISHIETGRREPSKEIAAKLMNILNMPEELFSFHDTAIEDVNVKNSSTLYFRTIDMKVITRIRKETDDMIVKILSDVEEAAIEKYFKEKEDEIREFVEKEVMKKIDEICTIGNIELK